MATVTNHSRYLSSHLDAARQTYPVMRKRPLGNTGLSVGEIGIGTSALGAAGLSAVPDEEAVYTLGLALDMQASLVDVVFDGSEGRALGLVGAAMRKRRHQAQVCLRIAGGPEEIRRNTAKALDLLGTDHVDVLLWDRPALSELTGRDSVWAALGAAKKAGQTLCVGASLESAADLGAGVEKTPAEVLRFPFNVFDQSAGAALEKAGAKGLGLIAARPLDSGWLTGRFGPNHLFLDARFRWSRQDKARRGALQDSFETLVRKSGTTVIQAALQFVLSHPVSCAVASVSAWQQVVGNVDAASGQLEPAVVEGLKRLWADEIQAQPLVP